MLTNCLLGDAFNVQQAENAEEGIQTLLSHAQECPFDIILMDLVMPGMGGIEAIRHIRDGECCADIPVITITAEHTDNALEQAFLAGATDYISKPICKVELLARVRAAVQLKREMDVRKQREAELLALSLHDALTALPNRRYFNDAIEMEWRRMRRLQKQLTLMMVDVDDFKAYNDPLGHPAGDECLRRIAQSMQHAARRPGDLAARWGGEEFVLLLPDTDAQAAMVIAGELLAHIREMALPHPASRAAGVVTASLGIASVVPKDGTQHDMLLDTADRALYAAKAQGRNCFVVENG